MSKIHSILLVLSLIFFYFILSFRLLEVPTGLTSDESSFGWNATLLSRTGRDENGVKLPLFVNSLNKSDWRQPYTQYYITLFFKIFGPSVYNLRLSSVILNLFSAYLLYLLIKDNFNPSLALISIFLFLLTPIVYLQSHLGLDNIMPIPFTILWLYFLQKDHHLKTPKYIFYSALFLGLSFYSYKGMRAILPVWAALSILYIFKNSGFKNTLFFIYGLLPIVFSVPLVSHFYPGAIFGGARPKFDSIYNFFYPFLSHLDMTYLFIKGDDLLFHSTKIHGMYLLSLLPLFIYGSYLAFSKKRFLQLVAVSYFLAPSLMGLVESVHRASRTMATVPLFIILCIVALDQLISSKKYIYIVGFIIFFLFNSYDFLRYYHFTYDKYTQNIFGDMKRELPYQKFGNYATSHNLTPYVHPNLYEGFFDSLYNVKKSLIISDPSQLPPLSLYLSPDSSLQHLKRLDDISTLEYNIYQIP